MSDYPLHMFRFHVHFVEDALDGSSAGNDVTLCSGAFSECTGLEATMEPKVINEGGRNYGAAQRSGHVTFSTVVLKRGMTTSRDLWRWFELVSAKNAYAYRLAALIRIFGPANDPQEFRSRDPEVTWRLDRVLPIKFRSADLNAQGGEVGIEELHLAHEGLSLVP